MISRDQTRQNYDRMSGWYDVFASSEKKFTEIGIQLLGIQPGEHVLEIGFGTGHSLVRLSRQVGESGLLVGIELSAGMTKIARKRLITESPGSCAGMVQGDATLLPFAKSSFNAVFLSFTLELFSTEEISVVLSECQRVLNREGRLAVVSLAKRDVLACKLYEWGHERWPAILDCRPIELQNRLETGGFRVQAMKVETMWGLPVEIVLGKPA